MTILRFRKDNAGVGTTLERVTGVTINGVSSPFPGRLVDVDMTGSSTDEADVKEAMSEGGWTFVSKDPTIPIPYASLSEVDGFVSAGQTQPTLLSGVTASDSAGLGITYFALASEPGCKWVVTDDDGTGVTIDYDFGSMSGGTGASVGVYNIKFRCANAFGHSLEFELEWTVT